MYFPSLQGRREGGGRGVVGGTKMSAQLRSFAHIPSGPLELATTTNLKYIKYSGA